MQQLLASKEALVSQGAKQALAAATVAASAELAAMRSTLQVLSSHLDALQAHPTALASTGAPSTLDPSGYLSSLFCHLFSACCQSCHGADRSKRSLQTHWLYLLAYTLAVLQAWSSNLYLIILARPRCIALHLHCHCISTAGPGNKSKEVRLRLPTH